MYDLGGRVIAVTGASSGIGRIVAFKAASAGAHVACCGRNYDKLELVRVSLPGEGHYTYLFDSMDLNGVEKMIVTAVKDMGPLSGVVHSAGISALRLLRDISYDSAMEMMQINFMVFLALAKGASRRGRYKPSEMSVVGISSLAGMYPDPGFSVYAASKAALNASVKSLAKEYASRGIRFNAVCPSIVNTPMKENFTAFIGENAFNEKIEKGMPLGLIEPDDVANSVLFLLSDESNKISGALIEINSGGSF
ncbi:MAG: SDR family oxidoreductase [Synergistaceae bacterium]|jgi:NAD(P)-dependent dehydrogenase (short-subunit alcohol dehydrogenase family)|nr:SDR family oxidoreductase [Synergistaceae bacterium]